MPETYGVKYSETGRISRKQLPAEVMPAVFDIQDALQTDPDAFPDRVKPISLDGKMRLYRHPSPPLEITYEVA